MIVEKRYDNPHKKYVEAIAWHKKSEGDDHVPPQPLKFRTTNEDGTTTVYRISNILAQGRMAARKAGGTGIRYVVDAEYNNDGLMIPVHFVLYYDDGMGDWFIEVD